VLLKVLDPVRGIHRKVFLCILAIALSANAELFCQDPSGTANSPAPFAPGEKLTFNVEWNPPWYLFFLPDVQAGDAELELAQELEYQGRKAFKIVFRVHSSGAFVKLVGIKVDDYFEYITDAETFCTIAATRRVREGRHKRDIDVVYVPASDQLHIRDVDLAVVPNKTRKDEYKNNIPKCVRDLFSALYWVRAHEFHAGVVHRSVVGNDDKVKEVESVVEKRELIVTPIGQFEAWRLNTMAILGGLFKDSGQFRFWLTADNRKLPVQFEARISLGKVTGKLKAAGLPPLAAEKSGTNQTK
jgi:hypothetical protein